MDAESLQIHAYEETIKILHDQITRRNQLIRELCAALVRDDHIWYNEGDELIQRAREATK